ncbi:hypothetical protein CC1G_15561 [Coprinopsis cinerea okayama7|uniref:Uncharacterized protein n=1 Tax=Coprinopsis cinerea (strain Okayama-7 / 130 / ATCC MYA-4618 / FGSC 9003) TaxID=240176 RepID=D6RN64_COPC7|nr:hypothetical protein CC1G_15561 [Coprinopsis cinerea okayama7\|eukprot:XP_002911019.1 hypothetical protein CC1G_15561 [Coprinopsis cinerea okayama7\
MRGIAAYPDNDPNAANDISIIFTIVPEREINFTNLDPDGHVIWMTSPIRKGRYFSVPGFAKPLPRLKGKKSKFEVRRAKGMEMGVFATRDIKRFETFLFERPYMVYPCQPLGFLAGSLSEEVENLDIDQQRQDIEGIMSLANSHKEDGSGPILGIIRTNSLGIMFRDSEADNEFGTRDTRSGPWELKPGELGVTFPYGTPSGG